MARSEPGRSAESTLPTVPADGEINGTAVVVDEAGTPTTPVSRLKSTAA